MLVQIPNRNFCNFGGCPAIQKHRQSLLRSLLQNGFIQYAGTAPALALCRLSILEKCVWGCTIRARWRCGLLSNYFDHLLCYYWAIIMCMCASVALRRFRRVGYVALHVKMLQIKQQPTWKVSYEFGLFTLSRC